MLRERLGPGILLLGLLSFVGAEAAEAALLKVLFSKPVAKKSVSSLDIGDTVVVTGIFKDVGVSNPINTTLSFKARVDGLTVGTAWRVGSEGAAIRTLGVNIDLVDANGVVLASDTFSGVLEGYAISSLSYDGLVEGEKYRLIPTGTHTTAGAYMMTIETR